MSFSFIRQHETNLLQGLEGRDGSTGTQWLLLCNVRDTPDGTSWESHLGLSAVGDPSSWVRWVGPGDRDGRGHIPSRVASSFRYLEMTMVSQQKSSRS